MGQGSIRHSHSRFHTDAHFFLCLKGSTLQHTTRDTHILHTLCGMSLIVYKKPVLTPSSCYAPTNSQLLSGLGTVWVLWAHVSEPSAQEDWDPWACRDMAVVCPVYVIFLTCLQALPLYQISTATLGRWWCCCQPTGTDRAAPCILQPSWKMDR